MSADENKATFTDAKESIIFKPHRKSVGPKYDIFIHRGAYTYDDIDKKYPRLSKRELKKPTKCKVTSFLPVVSTISSYNWKSSLNGDLVSGLSVAFLQMPQGLAYGILASLTPVSGFYTSFFPVLLYILFGTCPHISMGTNSVTALITAAMVERELDTHISRENMTNVSYESNANYKIGVASASSFASGLLLLFMGIFRVGFVTSYMPSSFVGGFTGGAAVHIVTSQIKHVFHIKIKTYSGAGKILSTYQDIAKQVIHANLADFIIALSSIVVLILFSSLVNPKIKSWRGYEIPINMIMIILLTAISHFMELSKKFGINTVGVVPYGLPTPALPDFMSVPFIIRDVVILTIITFTMSISMAMLMAKIHGYDVDSNKELIAYGLCNLGSSFFMCQVSSVSPPRTMVLSNSGASTMLNGVPTALFLFIMFFAGTLLEALPIAYLAAMIIVAVKDLLLQFIAVPKIWKISKADFFVWTGTWLVTVFLDLPYGIVAGVSISILGLVINNQVIQGSLIVYANDEDLLMGDERRLNVHHPKGIRIFYFPSQLFFANAEIFKKQLFKNVFDPTTVHAMDYKITDEGEDSVMDLNNAQVKCIIIDCSAMTYIDLDGVNMLKMVILLYRQVGIQILLARVPESTMKAFEHGDFFLLLPKSLIFHDVEDAIRMEHNTRFGVSRFSISFPSLTSIKISSQEESEQRIESPI